MLKELTEARRMIHAHPEPAFMERETADLIERTLKRWGVKDIHRPIPTCICAHLGSGHEPRIALRADIDCITQDEQNNVPWKSQVPGLMHGCGHDIHTAILLGVAKVLSRASLSGTCILLFQPAEEAGFPSGAEVLIGQARWLKEHGPDEMYALHVWPWLRTGQVGCREGPIMAAASRLEVTIRGRGGHAGMPHASVDAIVIASQVVSALQTIVSRQVDPGDQVVITVGKISGGSRPSIVAETVEMEGTVRVLSRETHELVQQRIINVCTNVASALGGIAEVTLKEDLPPTINDPACTRHMKAAAEAVLGKHGYVDVEHPPMTAEDFSRFLEHVPGAYAFLGCTPEGADLQPLHSSRFLPDENIIIDGVNVLVRLVHDFFSRRSTGSPEI